MDLGKLLNFIITAAIVFAGYKYFSTGDITFVPPNQETVRKLAKPIEAKLPPGTHLTVGQACARTGGGYIKKGVFTCEINVFGGHSSYARLPETANGTAKPAFRLPESRFCRVFVLWP